MNIFILDYNPHINVTYYMNKHVTKMCLEYAQILSTVCRLNGIEQGYRITHVNHPCCIWARESIDNWIYLQDLLYYLGEEHYYRFNTWHSSVNIGTELSVPHLDLKGLTKFALAMPDKYKNEDTVAAYRSYFLGEKQHLARWTNRNKPYWWI